MPNVNQLQKFLKADNVRNGDIVNFIDPGTISEKEFGKDGQEKKKRTILEMNVVINGDQKIYSPNNTTVGILSKAWGENTEGWVGKQGVVCLIEQLSFGELTNVLIVKPKGFGPEDIQHNT